MAVLIDSCHIGFADIVKETGEKYYGLLLGGQSAPCIELCQAFEYHAGMNPYVAFRALNRTLGTVFEAADAFELLEFFPVQLPVGRFWYYVGKIHGVANISAPACKPFVVIGRVSQ